MVLEATMIVVDNSESARNGDYIPTRWEAQQDAANLIFHRKTQANPESSVGLMSMGGSGPEVLTTLTTNPGKVLDGLHRTRVRGQSHLYTGVMVASLALKHRQNNSQRQRIICFVCSPLSESKQTYVKLAKKMRKNGVKVDIVAFGDLTDDNIEKLQAFHEAVNTEAGECHLEIVPPGPNLLSDTILSCPILAGEDGGGAAGGANGFGGGDGGAAAGNDFPEGVDPNVDPELALVLRLSMEEEQERRARERDAAAAAEGRTNLESVPEEQQPLIDTNGEASGSGSGAAEGEQEKQDDQDGGDKMDTA